MEIIDYKHFNPDLKTIKRFNAALLNEIIDVFPDTAIRIANIVYLRNRPAVDSDHQYFKQVFKHFETQLRVYRLAEKKVKAIPVEERKESAAVLLNKELIKLMTHNYLRHADGTPA